jgi:EAL domain-containing protein (putative c-di-GMP-specific phosphodiesterase class I)/ActR/RegA family two-component response regulator
MPSSVEKPASSGRIPVRARVLVVDDEEALRNVIARWLTRSGYEVVVAADGTEAAAVIESGGYDVIISDVAMPGLDGVSLLRLARARDPDVPVILVTGSPHLSGAIEAMRSGAFDYLVKPVQLDKLSQLVARAHLLYRMARVKSEALGLVSGGGLGLADHNALEASFERALASMWMAYQPIVRARDRSLCGYEALLRSNEKTLPHPGAVLDAAERLDRLGDLGRHVRALVAQPLSDCPADVLLFVNLHSRDLTDPTLVARDGPLAPVSRRVVLEITERASLDGVGDVRARVAELREMGFRIAIDDLGAGYAGLTSFVQLEPEFVKVDMSLVRGIDANTTKQKLVGSVVSLCRDLGMQVVAEGIETVEEREVLVSLGCDLLQGYLLARPGKAFPAFTW